MCFNTQPPEGGCLKNSSRPPSKQSRFNTQPPEGGCVKMISLSSVFVCFNTQPPEGGCKSLAFYFTGRLVSTHSRPKAAAPLHFRKCCHKNVSTHSRPKAAAIEMDFKFRGEEFQHTAARRRLRYLSDVSAEPLKVSTHSRPKAAAPHLFT